MSKLILQSPTGSLGLTFVSPSPGSRLASSPAPPGLHRLPQELLVTILSYLDLTEIGKLSLCGSMRIREQITSWMSTRNFRNKVLRFFVPSCDASSHDVLLFSQVNRILKSHRHESEEAGVDSWLQVMGEVGLLAKRASMIANTDDRLGMLSEWYRMKSNWPKCYSSKDVIDSKWMMLLRKIGLASALSSFIQGWDEVEFPKIVEWLSNLERNVITGDRRRVLRIFFWQFLFSDNSKAGWLGYLLKTFTDVEPFEPKESKDRKYAELMLCLFGPTDDAVFPDWMSIFQSEALTRLTGIPDYTALVNPFDGGYHEAKNIFADLGKALSTLLKSFSKRQLCSMIDCMFHDFHWHIDNQAACLLFSCEKLVKIYLSYIVNQGQGMSRFAKVLVALVSICGRMSNNLNQGLDKILEWAIMLPDYEEMNLFVDEFWAEFGVRLREDSIPVDMITQFGIFVTLEACKAAKKTALPDNMEIEE